MKKTKQDIIEELIKDGDELLHVDDNNKIYGVLATPKEAVARLNPLYVAWRERFDEMFTFGGNNVPKSVMSARNEQIYIFTSIDSNEQYRKIINFIEEHIKELNQLLQKG